MTPQLSHSNTPFKTKKFPLILICDGVQSPANIGGLFRICDAMGVERINFTGTEVDVASPRLKKTARNTTNTVNFNVENEIVSELLKLKKENYLLLALEITANSIPLESVELDKQKIALIIGNEQLGISSEILEMVQHTVHIEMFGKNSSMNVVQATGIGLYSLVRKLK
jgi:tRNA G18 (ribose-2'-O)-methylase SpoU